MHETKSYIQGLYLWLSKFQFGYFSSPLYLSLHTSSGPLIHPPIWWLSDLERQDCWVTDVLDAFSLHPASPLSNPCIPFDLFSLPILRSLPSYVSHWLSALLSSAQKGQSPSPPLSSHFGTLNFSFHSSSYFPLSSSPTTYSSLLLCFCWKKGGWKTFWSWLVNTQTLQQALLCFSW